MEAIENFNKYEKYVYVFSKKINSNVAKIFGGESSCYRSKDDKVHFNNKEDIHQQGRLWLWEACNLYPKERKIREAKNKDIEIYNDIIKGLNSKFNLKLKAKKKLPISSFSTYAWMYLNCMTINYNNKRNTHQFKKRIIGEDVYVEDWDEETEKAPSLTVSTNTEEEEIQKKLYFKEFCSKLNKRELDIFNAYFIEGKTKQEIKGSIPLYNKNIDTVIDKIRLMFKKERERLS